MKKAEFAERRLKAFLAAVARFPHGLEKVVQRWGVLGPCRAICGLKLGTGVILCLSEAGSFFEDFLGTSIGKVYGQ